MNVKIKMLTGMGLVLGIHTGCGTSQSDVIFIDNDTTIASDSNASDSGASTLIIKKTSRAESRALFRLPENVFPLEKENTWDGGKEDENGEMSEGMFPDCADTTLKKANIKEAHIELTLVDEVESLPSPVKIYALSKPWFQGSTWTITHPFSRAGLWETPGGDTDKTFSPVSATLYESTLRFDFTDYIKENLHETNFQNTGFLIKATQVFSGEIKVGSAQGETDGPALVIEYKCSQD